HCLLYYLFQGQVFLLLVSPNFHPCYLLVPQPGHPKVPVLAAALQAKVPFFSLPAYQVNPGFHHSGIVRSSSVFPSPKDVPRYLSVSTDRLLPSIHPTTLPPRLGFQHHAATTVRHVLRKGPSPSITRKVSLPGRKYRSL